MTVPIGPPHTLPTYTFTEEQTDRATVSHKHISSAKFSRVARSESSRGFLGASCVPGVVRCSAGVILKNPHNPLVSIILTIQMRKWRLREVKSLAQGHTAKRGQLSLTGL